MSSEAVATERVCPISSRKKLRVATETGCFDVGASSWFILSWWKSFCDSADLRQHPMPPVASHRAMPENRWRLELPGRYKAGARCGCSSAVEQRPSKALVVGSSPTARSKKQGCFVGGLACEDASPGSRLCTRGREQPSLLVNCRRLTRKGKMG